MNLTLVYLHRICILYFCHSFLRSRKAEHPHSFDTDIKAMVMHVPPPKPPWHLDHFLDWVYRQQTLWPAFLNFTRMEIEQMFSEASTQWMICWQWANCWNLVLHPVQSLEGQKSQLLWYADGESHRRTWELCCLGPTTNCSVEPCEVWWSSCIFGCTLQCHCVTNAPSSGSRYQFSGDPETTTDRWYSWICTHWPC